MGRHLVGSFNTSFLAIRDPNGGTRDANKSHKLCTEHSMGLNHFEPLPFAYMIVYAWCGGG